jgi:hypothetical protein
MGLDTKIYSNHNLIIPKNSEEVIELFMQSWKGKIKIHDKVEVDESDMISDVENSEIFINPKSIEFEFSRFNRIPISTNFRFTMNIYLYLKTICITPIGIGRNATNMIANFMNESIDFYHDDDSLNTAKKNWNCFKVFLYSFTTEIGGNKYIYINDGIFSGIEEIAWEGGTIDEMIEKSKEIVKPCDSTEQFIDKHTWVRPDGIRNVNGDIWFYEKRI